MSKVIRLNEFWLRADEDIAFECLEERLQGEGILYEQGLNNLIDPAVLLTAESIGGFALPLLTVPVVFLSVVHVIIVIRDIMEYNKG